jgi:hypothetical protein
VDQAHEHIAQSGAVLSLVAHRVFPVENGHFERAFADIMPTPGLCRVAA